MPSIIEFAFKNFWLLAIVVTLINLLLQISLQAVSGCLLAGLIVDSPKKA